MNLRPLVWAFAIAGALGAASLPAAAAPSAKEKAEAKALVVEAKTAAKKNEWAAAATALSRADELDPSPQTKLDLARALVQQKKLVGASKAANGAVDTAKGPGGKKVADAAKKLLSEIEPRVPWVQIEVSGPDASKALTTIDGEEVDARTEIPFDPGDHTVVVEADGFDAAEKKISLAEGEHEKVKIKLERSAGTESAPVAAEEKDEGGGSAVPAILAFGIGAAGIGVGAVFGIMAFSETDKVKGQCDGTRCPPEVQDALDVAKTNGTVSTVGFVVGGIGIASGVVLLLTSSGSKKTADDGADKVSVRPFFGPGQGGVTGRF
jgi:hypothetical protein